MNYELMKVCKRLSAVSAWRGKRAETLKKQKSYLYNNVYGKDFLTFAARNVWNRL